MTPDTLDFTGNATTFLGLIGIISTLAIYISVCRAYWTSPYRR
jgi:hypothetical protein